MPTKEQHKEIKATDRQVAAWNKRAATLKEAVESGNVTSRAAQSGRKPALIFSRAGSLSSAASSFPRLEKPSLRAYSRNSLIARRTSQAKSLTCLSDTSGTSSP